MAVGGSVVGSIASDVLTFGMYSVGSILTLAGWWALIEAIQTSEDAHRAVGASKTRWVLVILFTGGIAGVVWWFKVRRKVLPLVRNPRRRRLGSIPCQGPTRGGGGTVRSG